MKSREKSVVYNIKQRSISGNEMKPSIEDIKKLANIDLKNVKKGHARAEENVKIHIVVPLLNHLGYENTDLDFEHMVRSIFADIVVEIDNKPRISIECKDLDENLDAHLEQAFQYACWKGFMLLVLTNGKEFRVYKTWEVGTELEERLLFSSSLENLPESFFREKGLWDTLSKDYVIILSKFIDKWREAQSKFPLLASYIDIDGLFDHIAILPSKKEILEKAFQHLNNNQFSESIEWFKKCLAIDDVDNPEKVVLHKLIGLCFRSQDNFVAAHASFKEGLEIAMRIGDNLAIASSLAAIGVIYSDEGDDINALEYFKKALIICRDIGFRQGEVAILVFLGFKGLASREDCENALNVARDANDRQSEARLLWIIGFIHSKKGDIDNALIYFNKTLEISEEIGFEDGVALGLVGISMFYNEEGYKENFLKCIKKAISIIEKNKLFYPKSVMMRIIDYVNILDSLFQRHKDEGK